MDNIELANRINQVRTDDARSIKWLAEAASIPISTLRRKLLGVGDFTLPEIWRISQALRVEPFTLLPASFSRPAKTRGLADAA